MESSAYPVSPSGVSDLAPPGMRPGPAIVLTMV